MRCPNPVAEVCFEWVKLTSTGLRVSFQVTAADPGGISPPADAAMRRAMSDISVTDDTGRSYELAAEDVGWSRVRERQEQEWHGQVLLDPDPARGAWLAGVHRREWRCVRPGRLGAARPGAGGHQ